MKFTDKDILRIAELSRLTVANADMQKFTEQFNNILGYMDQIGQLDTQDVAPTAHVLPIQNVLREDILKPSISNELALQNAPQKENGCYVVPKVMEG